MSAVWPVTLSLQMVHSGLSFLRERSLRVFRWEYTAVRHSGELDIYIWKLTVYHLTLRVGSLGPRCENSKSTADGSEFKIQRSKLIVSDQGWAMIVGNWDLISGLGIESDTLLCLVSAQDGIPWKTTYLSAYPCIGVDVLMGIIEGWCVQNDESTAQYKQSGCHIHDETGEQPSDLEKRRHCLLIEFILSLLFLTVQILTAFLLSMRFERTPPHIHALGITMKCQHNPIVFVNNT